MAEMSRFGDALMLLGMGMQGNNQGISNYFAQQQQAKAEAEKQKRLEQFMSGIMGQAGGNQALQQFAPLVMAGDVSPSVLVDFLDTPDAQLDRQIKELQKANMQYEEDKRKQQATREAAILGGGALAQYGGISGGAGVPANAPLGTPLTPDAFGNAGQMATGGAMPSMQEILPALSQLGANVTGQPINQLPETMPPRLAAPAASQPAPEPMITPIEQPSAQSQPMTIEQFRQTPQGSAYVTAQDAKGLLSAYQGYVDNFQKAQQEMIKPQMERESLQKNKQTFSGAVDEIRDVYKKMREAGSIPTAEQDFVKREITARTSSLTDPANRQIVDGLLSRLRLSLMQATGMSAQVFNSNVEMQALMKALSSPETTYEANMAILDSLEKQYGAVANGNSQEQQQAQPEQQRPKYKEGDTLINRSTGERIILRDGKWQKL